MPATHHLAYFRLVYPEPTVNTRSFLMVLTKRQETFARLIFEGMTQREAWIQAGYSSKYPAPYIDTHACHLANKDKIKTRVAELNQATVDASVATVLERKRILTELARGNLLDYQEVGADGGYLSISKESPNTRAISEITSRTEYNNDGTGAALVTKVKLHSPTQAIDLLNKMDKLYAEGVTNNNVNVVFVIGRGYSEAVGFNSSPLIEATNRIASPEMEE